MEQLVVNGEGIQCGNIYLKFNNFTSKGEILVNCSFCEEQFSFFPAYTNHLWMEHYPQIELEDCAMNRNCKKIKEENSFENREDSRNVDTNAFINFLEMDLNKRDDIYYDAQEIAASFDEPFIDDITKKQSIHNGSIASEKCHIKFDKNKKCPHCDRTFFLSSSLRHHLQRHRIGGDSIRGLYKCTICQLEFDLKCSLMWHMREHRMKKIYPNHVQEIAPENKKEPSTLPKKINFAKKASISSGNGKTESVLTTSDLLVNTVESEEFHCELCNKNFSRSRFNAHMNRHKPCQFKCSTCLKEFKTSGELQTHTRFHTGERPYLCSSCGEKFATVSKLINHTRRHHTFERTKQCPICKKKFYAAGELKVHLQSTHSNERPYKCKICPATFNRAFSLRTHMKSHENKREYKCDFCPASFNQKCNLTAHKKKAHCLVTNDEKRD